MVGPHCFVDFKCVHLCRLTVWRSSRRYGSKAARHNSIMSSRLHMTPTHAPWTLSKNDNLAGFIEKPTEKCSVSFFDFFFGLNRPKPTETDRDFRWKPKTDRAICIFGSQPCMRQTVYISTGTSTSRHDRSLNHSKRLQWWLRTALYRTQFFVSWPSLLDFSSTNQLVGGSTLSSLLDTFYHTVLTVPGIIVDGNIKSVYRLPWGTTHCLHFRQSVTHKYISTRIIRHY